MTLVILVVVALGLFSIAFVTKRRFGVLGLGLAAGLVLSREISKPVAGFLQYIDFPVEPFSHTSAAVIFLILAPALVLLISGPKYNDSHLAIVGSAAFAIFGTVLLLAPLSMSFPPTDRAIQPTLSMIALNSSMIIAIAVIAAVVDMLYTHTTKSLGRKSKH